ncbi:MAG: hypothetical protein SVS85_03270, partial [Candidatus Nanohaloarchaea archaeon]|nr:hypothetical protein [Candidatus Nanohaloarchaea archaeon]
MVVLPLGVLGTTYLAFSSGLVLGLLLVSYKARSVYHEDNFGWTSFKAVGSLLTVLALVLGLTAAYT